MVLFLLRPSLFNFFLIFFLLLVFVFILEGYVLIALTARSPVSDGFLSLNIRLVANTDRVTFDLENFSTVLSLQHSQYYWIAALISASKYLCSFSCTIFHSTLSK